MGGRWHLWAEVGAYRRKLMLMGNSWCLQAGVGANGGSWCLWAEVDAYGQ